MKIQVNTDSSVKGDQRLESYVKELLGNRLERFKGDLTRVEVHLNDVNSEKGGADDKRCMMEARPKGGKPTAVTAKSDTIKGAIGNATGKLVRALDSQFGRQKEHR